MVQTGPFGTLLKVPNSQNKEKGSEYAMEYFDSHAHYNDEQFLEDRDELIQELYKQGVTKLICAGYNIESSKQANNIAKKYPHIFTICGISPNDVDNSVDNQEDDKINNEITTIKEMASSYNKVVAIGEIGLDYYWKQENKEIQKQYFIKQIQVANELNLPIVVHTREAVQDTIAILKQHTPNKKGIMHCCPFNRELVKEALKLGFSISFAGPVTFKNAKNADEIIQLVPLEKMLIETDCPYLSPEPNRGKRNHSGNLKYIVEKIAKVKQLTNEEIASITYQNACKIFNIKEI